MICLPEAPAGVIQAGVKQGGHFHPGFLCYGVPIEDEYVSAMLDNKVNEGYGLSVSGENMQCAGGFKTVYVGNAMIINFRKAGRTGPKNC